MNEIDRSVEPMDFAVRRRFTWVNIKPNDRTAMWWGHKWQDEAEKKMKNINTVISVIDSLGESYCIGPAYFNNPPLFMGKDDIVDWVQLWDIRISPLLDEYFRGLPKQTSEGYKSLILKAYNRKSLLQPNITAFEKIKKSLNTEPD